MQAHKIDHKMHGYRMKVLRGWKKTKSDLFGTILKKYQRCVLNFKRCILPPPRPNKTKRLSRTKLHPLPGALSHICRYIIDFISVLRCARSKLTGRKMISDRPIRRAASKLSRKPTNELERMRRKGDNWTANDLFRFQYGCFDDAEPDQLREICEEWLSRLYAIPKKYCYLAWYASAIYSCYYRIAPLVSDIEDKRDLWMDVKREYAEIFQMGRRIWRRPTHPSRLRVVYDVAMLCVRFNDLQNDPTIILFRDLLADQNNFDFSVLDEVEYAQSIDKTVRLENHVIDLFFERRKSVLSNRSSIRSKTSSDTPGNSFRLRRSRNDSERSNSLGARAESKGSKERSEPNSAKSSFRSRKGSVSPRGRLGDTVSTKSNSDAKKLSPVSTKSEPCSPHDIPKDKCSWFAKDTEHKRLTATTSFRMRRESKDINGKAADVNTRKFSLTEKRTVEPLVKKSSFKKKLETNESNDKMVDNSNNSTTSPTSLLSLTAEDDKSKTAHLLTSTPTSPRSVRFAGDPFDSATTQPGNELNPENEHSEPCASSDSQSSNESANDDCDGKKENDKKETANNSVSSSNEDVASQKRSMTGSISEIISIVVTEHGDDAKS